MSCKLVICRPSVERIVLCTHTKADPTPTSAKSHFPPQPPTCHPRNLRTSRIAPAMRRPAISLEPWLRLRQSLAPASGAAPNSHAIFRAPSANPLAFQKNTPSSKRFFHNTRAQNAALQARKSPAARAKEREAYVQAYNMPGLRGLGSMNRDGFYVNNLGDTLADPDGFYKDHLSSAPYEYDKAIADGFIPKAISFKTYKSVKMKLIDAAMTARPNAQAIRAISAGK